MKPKYTKLISVLVCIAVVFTAIALTRTELHGATTDTVLFYNDRTWTISSRLPAERVHSVYYVPISFLVQLPGVDVRMNESLGTFIITHGDLFLSFDTTTDFAANQDKERTYIKTAEYHNERYVPVRTVCAYLNLGYEEIKNSVTGVTAIRITDGNQQSELRELVRQKYPSLFPEEPETTAPPPDTSDSGATDSDTDRTPTLSARVIYITFDGCSGKYTSSILSVLKRYGYKATFFVSESEVGGNAALLSKISAGGHEIALTLPAIADGAGSATEALSSLNAQNAALSRLIKKKTRVWRFSPSNKSDEEYSELKNELLLSGYVMWGDSVAVPTGTTASAAASIAIDAIWESTSTTLRFTESRNTAEALRLVLEFIKTNRNACDVRVITPAFYGESID